MRATNNPFVAVFAWVTNNNRFIDSVFVSAEGTGRISPMDSLGNSSNNADDTPPSAEPDLESGLSENAEEVTEDFWGFETGKRSKKSKKKRR